MQRAKLLAVIGLFAMTAAILYAILTGNFRAEGALLTSMPWGIVSLVDLYVGFCLFSGWIVYREASRWRAVIWIVLMMGLGFWTGALYTLLALHASQGNWNRFWLGTHYNEEMR
ncbi:DUF1475 domain-containing protein [candidate division KSB3 bacterium]|uniref:DUF1475 domain-containing protein n=1 Tax=candidate division KSB3 bacterium TaxID=2044937 RepID=A0A9D5Q6H4_9BACT|nr:DUF1475 domain-containing protein [candidate division KSB3 bacterium]MBD3325393.1 DUF1475 domain-containing protein [candidate division KSB3 bacterium]